VQRRRRREHRDHRDAGHVVVERDRHRHLRRPTDDRHPDESSATTLDPSDSTSSTATTDDPATSSTGDTTGDPPACGAIVTFADDKTPTAELHVAPNGVDDPGCGAVDSPCASIEGAVGLAQPGTAVRIHSGTYAARPVHRRPRRHRRRADLDRRRPGRDTARDLRRRRGAAPLARALPDHPRPRGRRRHQQRPQHRRRRRRRRPRGDPLHRDPQPRDPPDRPGRQPGLPQDVRRRTTTGSWISEFYQCGDRRQRDRSRRLPPRPASPATSSTTTAATRSSARAAARTSRSAEPPGRLRPARLQHGRLDRLRVLPPAAEDGGAQRRGPGHPRDRQHHRRRRHPARLRRLRRLPRPQQHDRAPAQLAVSHPAGDHLHPEYEFLPASAACSPTTSSCSTAATSRPTSTSAATRRPRPSAFTHNLWYAPTTPDSPTPPAIFRPPRRRAGRRQDPAARRPRQRRLHLTPGSPAAGSGTTFPALSADLDGVCYAAPPSRGAFELR
jgi:hypothetical protein